MVKPSVQITQQIIVVCLYLCDLLLKDWDVLP